MMIIRATVHQKISISPQTMRMGAIGAARRWNVHCATIQGNRSTVDTAFEMEISHTRLTIWLKGTNIDSLLLVEWLTGDCSRIATNSKDPFWHTCLCVAFLFAFAFWRLVVYCCSQTNFTPAVRHWLNFQGLHSFRVVKQNTKEFLQAFSILWRKSHIFHLQILWKAIEAQKLEIRSSGTAGNMHTIAAQSKSSRRSSVCHQAKTREYFSVEEIDRRTWREYEKIART